MRSSPNWRQPTSAPLQRKAVPLFSVDAKDEVSRVRFQRACCPGIFVRALAAFSAGPQERLVFSDRPAIARAALSAARRAGIVAAVTRRTVRRFRRHVAFDVRAEGSPGASAPPARDCCRRTYLRAAFLASGSVSDPSRGYHLEFACRDMQSARTLRGVLEHFSIGAAQRMRRGRPVVYVKGAAAVADILGQMGAAQAVFRLENVRAMRQTKNAIRRLVNAEMANASRAAASGARQRDAALQALRRVGPAQLSAALAEAARLRIAHPELTLAQLARRARPSVAKATMSYRMRTLEQLAKRRSGAAPKRRPTSQDREGRVVRPKVF